MLIFLPSLAWGRRTVMFQLSGFLEGPVPLNQGIHLGSYSGSRYHLRSILEGCWALWVLLHGIRSYLGSLLFGARCRAGQRSGENDYPVGVSIIANVS